MQCMKCGRDVDDGQVFCESCLTDMEKHPVKPGTAVVIPQYLERPAPKRPAKRVPTQEEQLRKVRRLNRILAVLLVIYMAVAGVLGYLWLSLGDEQQGKYLPGQNYSAIQDDEPDETTLPSGGEK